MEKQIVQQLMATVPQAAKFHILDITISCTPPHTRLRLQALENTERAKQSMAVSAIGRGSTQLIHGRSEEGG